MWDTPGLHVGATAVYILHNISEIPIYLLMTTHSSLFDENKLELKENNMSYLWESFQIMTDNVEIKRVSFLHFVQELFCLVSCPLIVTPKNFNWLIPGIVAKWPASKTLDIKAASGLEDEQRFVWHPNTHHHRPTRDLKRNSRKVGVKFSNSKLKDVLKNNLKVYYTS